MFDIGGFGLGTFFLLVLKMLFSIENYFSSIVATRSWDFEEFVNKNTRQYEDPSLPKLPVTEQLLFQKNKTPIFLEDFELNKNSQNETIFLEKFKIFMKERRFLFLGEQPHQLVIPDMCHVNFYIL